MKKLLVAVLVGLCCLVGALCPAQGFQNLDFELADTSSVAGNSWRPITISASNAIPYWTAGQGDGLVHSSVLYNSFHATTAGQTALIDGLEPSWLPPPLQGYYSMVLGAGYGDPFGGAGSGDSFISQTGWVPSAARSIRFTTSNGGLDQGWDDPYELTLSFNGQAIPYVETARDNHSLTFAADASSFAGDTVELQFYLHNLNPAPDAGILVALDNISFSTELSPEPSAFTLLGVSMVMLMMLRTKANQALHTNRRPPLRFKSHLRT